MRLAATACLIAVSVMFVVLLARIRAAEPAGPGYHVSTTYQIGGEGRWDYVSCNPATKLLYISRQSHVQVVNETNGAVVADVKNTPGVHGIALAPDLNRGFISNGQGNSVTVFDLKTNKEIGTVPAGQNPDCIIFDPASQKVLAFNGRSRDVTVIDAGAEPAAPAAIARIALPGKPEFAAADGHGHVYVNIEDKNSIQVIDTKAMKATDLWPIEGGEEPSGLAIDADHHRLFAGCGNQVMAIVDSETGKTLGTVHIGKGVDACGFDPGAGDAFASCGDATLTVVKETAPGKFEAVQTVQTRRGARTMTVDTATHTIYLPTADFPEPVPGERRAAPKPGSFMIVVVSPGQP